MQMLEPFTTTLTLCFTPEHMGIQPHYTSPPKRAEDFAEFAVWAVRKYAAAGFVGSHLVDALLAAGHNVRVFDNLTPQVHGDGVPAYLSPEAEFMGGEMQDAAAVHRALDGVEVVFHMAAAVGVGQSMYEISHYMGSNTQGTA